MSAEIVNLNQFRKRQMGVKKSRQASANRTKFGRTKGEKLGDQKKSRHSETRLSGHELDDEPA